MASYKTAYHQLGFNICLSCLLSSIVITPSLETCFIASAISSPISGSLLADIVAICWISESLIGVANALISLITLDTVLSISLLANWRMPAAIYFKPSATIAWVRIVAVVVPSPKHRHQSCLQHS